MLREAFSSNNNSSNGFQSFANSDNNSSSFDPNDDVESKTENPLLAKLVSLRLKWLDENNVTVTDQRKDKSNPLFDQVLSFQELNVKHENWKKRNKTDIFLIAKLVSSVLKWVDVNNVTVIDQRKD